MSTEPSSPGRSRTIRIFAGAAVVILAVVYAVVVTGPPGVVFLVRLLVYAAVLYLLLRLVRAHERLAEGIHRIADSQEDGNGDSDR